MASDGTPTNDEPIDPATLTFDGWRARALEITDVEATTELLNDPGVVAARTLPPPTDDAGTRAWINRAIDDPTCVPWLLESIDGRPAGFIALQGFDRPTAVTEVGYSVLPWARGRGLASRALAAISAWAFDTLGTHRIYLVHDVDNPASCRVAAHAGFRVEGVLRSARPRVNGTRVDSEIHGRTRADHEDDSCS